MDINWWTIIFSAAVGAVFGGILSGSMQKITNRRETLLNFHLYYEKLVNSLKDTYEAANELLKLPLASRISEKEKQEKFDQAEKSFQKQATDVIELTMLISVDFDWSEKVFEYFRPAIKESKECVSDLKEAINDKEIYSPEISALPLRVTQTIHRLGRRYANVKKFFILQMNVFWVVLPTFCLHLKIFYEQTIGCSFVKWLFHESPPQLKKDEPVCCLIMEKRVET